MKCSDTISMSNTCTRFSNGTPLLCQCLVFWTARYRCEKTAESTKYSSQTHPWENKSGQYHRMSQGVTLASY